jgi:hypothetical protein
MEENVESTENQDAVVMRELERRRRYGISTTLRKFSVRRRDGVPKCFYMTRRL